MWNDNHLKRMFLRIKEEAIRGGVQEDQLKYLYLDDLTKQTKSPRTLKFIKEAYYRGFLKGIKYVDEMKTPVGIEPLFFPDFSHYVLKECSFKGNAGRLVFKSEEASHIEEVFLKFESLVISHEELKDINYENYENIFFIVNPKRSPFKTISEQAKSENSVIIYNNESYKEVTTKLKPLMQEIEAFPENQKILDFEIYGNQVKLFLGNENTNDYYGDDWDDYPYEHNAGKVYSRFVSSIYILNVPFKFSVFEPSDFTTIDSYCMNDMKDGVVPAIILSSNSKYYDSFEMALGDRDSIKIYLNDKINFKLKQ